MWMSDVRVICTVWGCARCLSVCLRVCLASRCVSGRAWPLCVCSAECTRAHPSCYCLRLSVLPFVNGTIPSLELPHTLCTVRTLFTQGSFVYVLYFLYFLHSISSLSIRLTDSSE